MESGDFNFIFKDRYSGVELNIKVKDSIVIDASHKGEDIYYLLSGPVLESIENTVLRKLRGKDSHGV